ncbi:MAG TPA: outer membrane protein assembly factor BamD [Nitrospirae bacterium]|nr:outer membrane protein assembly factor BamD precursor [bacterium BMS3Bbin09]HDK81612.1 outer membrane protein assembly factor BamD [Nitrospirota bacterium]HDO26364.1 outer membrane protein assembly factor BamD [Nitrospirota bacterium]
MKHEKIFRYTKNCLLLGLALFLFTGCSFFREAIKEKPFNAEESFQEANKLMKDGFNKKAREIFETVLAQDASRKYSTLAKVRIGDTYFEDELYDEAIVEYEGFLDIHPYHKYAPYAQYKIAMSYFNRIKTVDVSYSWARKALDEFKKLREDYPRNPYMDAIDSRIRTCKRYLAEYEFYVGNFYFKKKAYQAAAQRFDGMLLKYPNSRIESEALYYLGLSYKNIGDKEKAIVTLSALIDKFPATRLSAEAKGIIDSFNNMPDTIEKK